MNKIIDSNSTFEIPSFTPQKILGWHFSKNTKLRYNDKRPIIIGKTLSVEGKIIPCKFGLHASEKALDAFDYVRGNYLWRVELEGDLQSHGNPIDKWVGRHRKVLAGGDATKMLLKFGRDCALEVIHLSSDAPKEVKTFLETGVITKVVENYFYYYNNKDASAYNVYTTAYYAYVTCKINNISYVHDTIYYAAKALGISFETYTSKFEQACLKFIEKKS